MASIKSFGARESFQCLSSIGSKLNYFQAITNRNTKINIPYISLSLQFRNSRQKKPLFIHQKIDVQKRPV